MKKILLFTGRSAFIFLFMIIAFFVYQKELFAGTTGKIAGRVLDAKTQEPLPMASIVIKELKTGAASNIDGKYFIINVPPGIYTLSVSMIGYETLTLTGVSVSVDHTTPQDFQLKPTDIQGQEIIIVAKKENIKRDVSASQVVADVEQITSIPLVNDLNAFVNLQAGVDGNDIRSGGLDQRGYMVDGLISVDNRRNEPLVLTNMSTVQQLTLVKGGFNAEYGNIRSGLVNVVTKDPDFQKIHVYADLRFTPARQKHNGPSILSPDNWYNKSFMDPGVAFVGTANGTWDAETQAHNLKFVGWNQWVKDNPKYGLTPQQAQQLFMWQRAMEGSGALGQKELSYGDKSDYSGDISISGGVPFIGEALGNLSFLASISGNWQQFKFPTALDYYSSNTSSLKLVSRVASNMKLGFMASYNQRNTVTNSTAGNTDDAYYTNGNNDFNSYVGWWPYALVPHTIYNSVVGISFDHVLSNSTFYTLRISQVHIVNSAREWGQSAYRDTTTKAFIGSMPLDEQPYGWALLNNGTYIPVKDAGGAIYSTDAGGTRNNSSSTSLNIKFDLTSQLDNYNQFQTGIDFTYDDVRTDYARVRYMAEHESFHTQWTQFPFRLGAYIQDKLEFEGMIANIGVRFDYNDPNGDWFSTADPYSKYFTKPYMNLIGEAPRTKAKGHLKISPRLGISHPIGEDMKLFFNYGHFYSMPQTSNMYRIDWGIDATGVTNLGNPFLNLPRTIAYELGVDWDIAREVLVRLSAYYKNIDSQINSVTYTNYPKSVNYATYNNSNYQDVRGFEIQIEKNFGWIRGLANYTYEVNTYGNTGRNHYYQDPTIQANDMIEDPNVSREQIRPWANVALQIHSPQDFGPVFLDTHPFGDWIISPKLNWRAGQYITLNPDNVLGSGIQNNVQWSPSWSVDIRISKRFFIDKISIDVYADINNLFNHRIINSATNDGFRTDNSGVDLSEYYRSLHLPLYSDSRFDPIRDEARGFYLPGNDKPGDINSEDKPYINMPDIDFLTFTDIRYVTLGLRVNF